jgi:hypothetical protein
VASSDVDRLVVVLGLVAAAASALAGALVIRLHLVASGVDPVTEGVSLYARGPFGILYRAQVRMTALAAACIAGGCLLLGLGSPLGEVALVTFAMSRVAIVRYPTDPPGTTVLSATGRMHVLLASMAFVGIAIAAPAIGFAMDREGIGGPIGFLLVVLSVAVPFSVMATFGAGAIARRVFGLVERTVYVTALSWLMVSAAVLAAAASA